MINSKGSIMEKVDDIIERCQIEDKEKWGEVARQIPFLPFPFGWQVKVIPPFAGAVARFQVTTEGSDKRVSVYLDWYDRLGIEGEPYWEIYPNANDDTSRFMLNETDELISAIHEALKGTSNDLQP